MNQKGYKNGELFRVILLALVIVTGSLTLSNFYLAGLPSSRVRLFGNLALPVVAVAAYFLLAILIPRTGYLLLVFFDHLARLGLATHNSYFHDNPHIHSLLANSKQGLGIVDSALEILPQGYALFLLVSFLLHCLLISSVQRMKARAPFISLFGLLGILGILIGVAAAEMPYSHIKILRYHSNFFRLHGFYSAVVSEYFLTEGSPSLSNWEKSHQQMLRSYPLKKISLDRNNLQKTQSLLVLQIESLDQEVLNINIDGKEVTPFFNRLKRDSLSLSLNPIHTSSSGSSGSDFQFLTGLLPVESYPCYLVESLDYSLSLPKLLAEVGISSWAWHGNSGSYWGRSRAFRKAGFSKFYDLSSFKEPDTHWGVSDETLFSSLRTDLSKKEHPGLFFAITLSSHIPFNYIDNPVFSSKDIVGSYFNSINYVDGATREFLSELSGNYFVIIYGDHASGVNKSGYESIPGEDETVPAFIFELSEGKISRPDFVSLVDKEIEGYDIRSLHHLALDYGLSVTDSHRTDFSTSTPNNLLQGIR